MSTYDVSIIPLPFENIHSERTWAPVPGHIFLFPTTSLISLGCISHTIICHSISLYLIINVNASGKGKPTPLCKAATAGHARVVKALLTHPNIKPNECESYDGSSALLNAAAIGSVEIVDLLLQDGRVNPLCADDYGRTVLWWAAFKGHTAVARCLLGSFRMNIIFPSYYDPLSVAEEECHWKIAKLIQAARRSTTSSINSIAC